MNGNTKTGNNSQLCEQNIKLHKRDHENLKIIANTLIENQSIKKEASEKLRLIIDKNKEKFKFAFGRRDKTKYGDKAIQNLSDNLKWTISKVKSVFTRNRCRMIVYGGSTIALCTPYVQNLISSTILNYSNLESIFSIVDVGYRIPGYDQTDYITIILNSIGFALSAGLDWWFYLTTPFGFAMFAQLINRDPRQFINMLAHASFMGVGTRSILRWVPSLHINICRPNYEGFVGKIEYMEDTLVEFVINKLAFESTKKGINFTYLDLTKEIENVV